MVAVATCNLVDAFLPLCKCFCCLGNCCGCLMERLVYLVKMKLLMGFMYLFTLVFAATVSIRIKPDTGQSQYVTLLDDFTPYLI